MLSLKKQKGEGASTIVLYVFVGVMLATVVLKLGPLYMDNNTVSGALDSLEEQMKGKDVYDVSNKTLRSQLKKLFSVNMVSKEITQAIDVRREKQDVIISVNYEKRVNMFGNVDAVVVFTNERNLAGE